MADEQAVNDGAVEVVERDDPNSDEAWLSRIDASIAYRKEFLRTWRTNVAYRMQKPFTSTPEAGAGSQDRFAIPEDWARTNQKVAQLMFAVPKVSLKAKAPQYQGAGRVFQAAINDSLVNEVRAQFMLDECLNDVVNAAGLMVSSISYSATTESMEVDVPQPMPVTPIGVEALPQETVKEQVTRIIHEAYSWTRTSPASLLWPAEFSGSDWDSAPWLGEESYMLIKQALREFKELPKDFKPNTSKPELLSEDADLGVSRRAFQSDGYVKVRTIWYKKALFTDQPTHPDRLCRKVFVEGHPTAVIDEDTLWQVEVPLPTGGIKLIGIPRYPIRVGTLRYVSDLAVPPSDSEAGRPQVREMIRSRSQILRQRDHSIPIRWYDVNRMDPLIMEAIQRGEWQDIIPTNGPGERVIGEVARAQYPRENFTFATMIGADLDKAWSLSNNQMGMTQTQDRSAAEINTIQSASDARMDYERNRVLRYVADGAEVLAGLKQLFQDDEQYVEMLGPERTKMLQAWNKQTIAGDFIFDFIPDTGTRVDIGTKQANALKMYNLLAQSPTVNRPRLEQELMTLHGFDAEEFTTQPPPEKPEPPNVSYRFAGEDLLTNPIAVAVMMKTSAPLTASDIEAAKQLIVDASGFEVPPPAPKPGAGGPPQAGGPPPTQGQPIESAPTADLIAKRAADGTHMV